MHSLHAPTGQFKNYSRKENQWGETHGAMRQKFVDLVPDLLILFIM